METILEQDTLFPLLDAMGGGSHEQVTVCSRPDVGLKAVIAIHDTTLGPSLGGVRMWPYRSEREALTDVLRLSRGMTYKAAISGLNLGGGKAVIIGDSRTDKTEGLFRAFGRFVQGLGGRYITAEDVGMEERDMAWIAAETDHVTGRPASMGGLGDPSPVTAYGVYMGMKACAKKMYGSDSLEGRTVSIQGAGHVAGYLAHHLHKEGARLVISDLYPEKAARLAQETGGRVVEADDIYGAEADIFAPCALGGVVNEGTIGRLTCAIVAGGANNVLLDPDLHARALQSRGILYAPDYAINAGGVMHVSGELEGRDGARSYDMAKEIYGTMLRIFDRADRDGITTAQAADQLAEERIRTMASIGNVHRPSRR